VEGDERAGRDAPPRLTLPAPADDGGVHATPPSAFPGGAAVIGPRFLVRSWRARVAVAGRSMEPAIADGDWLLVDPEAWRGGPPEPGALVLLADPRAPERLLVKRVHAVLPDATLDLRGDAPDRSTDSRHFGPVPVDALLGRPWLRIHPLRRVGRIR